VKAAQVLDTARYWRIGRLMVGRQTEAGWGARLLDRPATDLRPACPGLEGFSRRNLDRMRALHLAYPEGSASGSTGGIPWPHHVIRGPRADSGGDV